MKKLQNHLIGVDNGDVVVFSDFDSDGPMWAGQGPRIVRHAVTFGATYRTPPSVNVWVTMLDASDKTFTRVDVQAEEIAEKGFEIVFRTWGDTKIARARVGWQSIGELFHDDDWDLY